MRGTAAASLAESRRARTVTVEFSARACINCQYYEQYYHQNRGNTYGWVPVSKGYCLLKEHERGALRQPCKDFQKQQEGPKWKSSKP